MKYETAVLKIGGSVITNRSADEATPLKEEMQRTAEEISTFDGGLVLVHGAGSYGHPQVARSDLQTGVSNTKDRMDLARIQRLQNELNALYCHILQEHDVPAFPLQPSSFLIMEDGELVDTDISAIQGFLDLGMVPVLYGVPAYDTVDDLAILSGDTLAPFIGDKIDADIVLHATDIDGVYDRDPSDPDAELLDELDHLPDAVSDDTGKVNVTGGMHGKVEQLFEYGQNGQIFNGKTAGSIEAALKGKQIGTITNA